MAAEESLEDLYENAPCGYLSTTLTGQIVKVNTTFLRSTGYSADHLVGQVFEELLSVGSLLLYETRCLPVLTLNGELREVALELRCFDGHLLPILLNSVVQTPVDGQPPLIRSAIFDSTERHDYEQEFRVARREAEVSESRLRVLQNASEDFAAAATEAGVLTALAEITRTLLDAAATWVMLADPTVGTLDLAVPGASPLDNDTITTDSPRPEAVAWRLGEVVALTDLSDVERRFPALMEPMQAARLEAMVVTPMTAEATAIGVLVCVFRRRRAFDETTLKLMRALTLQATQVVERMTVQAQLHHAALHDQLTGLPNRAFVHERLEQVVAQARRSRGAMALIFFDLDGFKAINDTLGHVVGDSVLVQVAERLRGAVRVSDTVGRFGGDEFVAVCDGGTEPTGYIDVAERIRAAVEGPLKGVPDHLSATASIGVAHHRPAVGFTTEIEELLRAADAAMYRSKADGKNRITVVDV